MMQMLDAGGIPALTDGLRQPDPHNPRGYFEYEPVKRLAENSAWLKRARGVSVKIIYRLLVHLPPGLKYRILFMERDLNEVFDSQRDMLAASGEPAADQDRDLLVRAFTAEVRAARERLAQRREIRVLDVPYADVICDPVHWAGEVARFLDGGLDEAAMAAVVDPSLHRHKGGPG